MAPPDLVPAHLPTLPTAQLLARLSAEPGRCEMTVDPASPWVAGVIVRTPRMLLALHAVNSDEAQIIAAARVPGLQGTGDAQLQALLASAAPRDGGAYRPVPPPAPDEAAPPPLEASPVLPARAEQGRPDLPLLVTWGLFGMLALTGRGDWLTSLTGLLLIIAVVLTLLGIPRSGAQHAPPGALRTTALVTGILGLLTMLFAVGSAAALPALLLAVMSISAGLAARLGSNRSLAAAGAASSQPIPSERSPQALPAPQLQLIELTRDRLTEHLLEAERSGNPRDVFEARQALEVHLPDVVGRWEALPSWRRRDEAPLRRTLEQLATASLPDTTTSELEWDATERFIEQKARAKASEAGDFPVGREPLTPPARIPDKGLADPTKEKS